MTNPSDRAELVVKDGKNIIRIPYSDYILVGQGELMEKPMIHTNADALMIGRAYNMIKVQFIKALEELTPADRAYVEQELHLDRETVLGTK